MPENEVVGDGVRAARPHHPMRVRAPAGPEPPAGAPPDQRRHGQRQDHQPERNCRVLPEAGHVRPDDSRSSLSFDAEPSPHGRLVIVTNKKAQSVSLLDAQALTEVARVPTTKSLPHGVAYAPDGRWAFVSQESGGADPGAVDVIDLATRTRVASVAIRGQPTGITILPTP